MAEVPQTDVSRPSALPSAAQKPAATAHAVQGATAYLDQVQEDYNKRVDADVEVLVDGMLDLVDLASINTKDKFRIAQDSFQIQIRAESMIRAAHSLLSITHSIKLIHLLSDEPHAVQQRDKVLRNAQAESEEYKDKVASLFVRSTSQPHNLTRIHYNLLPSALECASVGPQARNQHAVCLADH